MHFNELARNIARMGQTGIKNAQALQNSGWKSS
jgi:hypothetical protein